MEDLELLENRVDPDKERGEKGRNDGEADLTGRVAHPRRSARSVGQETEIREPEGREHSPEREKILPGPRSNNGSPIEQIQVMQIDLALSISVDEEIGCCEVDQPLPLGDFLAEAEEVDDREAIVAKSDPSGSPGSVGVGAAMGHRVRHRPKQVR